MKAFDEYLEKKSVPTFGNKEISNKSLRKGNKEARKHKNKENKDKKDKNEATRRQRDKEIGKSG